MSATTSAVSSWSTASRRAVRASSGAICRIPSRRSRSATSPDTMPPSAQAPHATDVTGSPDARRCSAKASRNAFAAAYAPWAPPPHTPAPEEYTTKASSWRPSSASARFVAPVTLASRISARSATSRSASGVSWLTPAVWTTALITAPSASRRSRRASTAPRSATSQVAIVTRAPRLSSSARRSDAPGASPPRRLVSTRCSAPPRASQRAACAPRAPVPPVTTTVSLGRQERSAGAGALALTSRRANVPAGRTATSSSPLAPPAPLWPPAPSVPPAPPSTAASRASARPSTTSGRSTSPPHRWGCSNPMTRPSPHTCACAALRRRSDGATDTAPEVTHHSGASTAMSPRACPRANVAASPPLTPGRSGNGRSSTASSDSTPPTTACGGSDSRSRRASAPRSRSAAVGSTRTTCAPRSDRAAAHADTRPGSAGSAGATSSHVPGSATAGASTSGFQVTRYRQSRIAALSACRRRQADSAGSTARNGCSPSTSRVAVSAARSRRCTASQKRSSAGPAPAAGALCPPGAWPSPSQ